MVVLADGPYMATRVSLYLREMHASYMVCTSVAMHQISCPTGVGRGAQHKVAIALGDQAHGPIRRTQGFILRDNSMSYTSTVMRTRSGTLRIAGGEMYLAMRRDFWHRFRQVQPRPYV